MKETLFGLSFDGSKDVAWTRMYVTPDGRLFPVLGEPLTITKENMDAIGVLV